MTEHIVIIPCGARKLTGKHPAGRLYVGPYFKACLSYALSLVDVANIYILSAKYGLLALTDVIEAYDMTIGQPGCATLQQVATQARERELLNFACIAVGGQRYTSYCQRIWKNCKTPLTGVGGNGKQLQWMKQHRGVMP